MESYLRKIVKEYEENLRHFAGDPPSLEVYKLERSSEFIAASDESGFKTDFVDKYHLALKSVRTDILTATTRSQGMTTKAPNA